jgi:predicted acylesterase/phospholipase RssA
MPPRRSLILAGGGMRVAYQAGVLRALDEAGLEFEHADGTSGGIINLAMLLSGQSPEEMCRRWREVDVRRFASFLPLHEYLDVGRLPALGDADGIRAEVFPALGIDVERIRAAAGIQGTFNVCNFDRKVSEAVPHQQVDLDLLVAGISLPIFTPPVLVGGARYLDAVWIRDANLMEAVRRGAEELWVVWCIGNHAQYRDGPFQQYVHMIELSANGSLFGELERIAELNDRIRAGEAVGGRSAPIRLHLVKPAVPLPLDPDLYLGHIDTATLIAMGYQDAHHYLDGIDPEGLPLGPEVTRMRDPRLGISFREVMAGGFSLGATDPRAGREAGEAAGTTLTMRVAIDIDDLDRFIEDPDHQGRLSGTVSFPPLGDELLATRGIFNLFSPGAEAGSRRMVYELGLRHQGRDLYLAGRKEVKDDFGPDLLADTTTLFTTLHEGRSTSGPVIGAGTLRLGIRELKDLAGTMHATNAAGPREAAEALARFGRFFLGELWKTYNGPAGRATRRSGGGTAP